MGSNSYYLLPRLSASEFELILDSLYSQEITGAMLAYDDRKYAGEYRAEASSGRKLARRLKRHCNRGEWILLRNTDYNHILNALYCADYVAKIYAGSGRSLPHDHAHGTAEALCERLQRLSVTCEREGLN